MEVTDWPKLTILLLTKASDVNSDRAVYARRTLTECLDKLTYSGQISVHIADDGSPWEHADALLEIAGGYSKVLGVSVSNTEGHSYGASYNLASQQTHIHASIVLPLEDDWTLAHPFCADDYVRATIENPAIGCIRMGYLGYTQPLRGQLIYAADEHFLLFDPDSPERHVAAGHPRLETVGWQRRVGPWPEGIDAGTTEFLWCGREEARSGVVWPMSTPRGGWFVHTGTVQAREDQR